MSTLLSVSVALIAGLLMTRVFKPFKLPSVTAYLVSGVLIGPYIIGAIGIHGFGFTSFEDVDKLSLISQVALGFIAFSIGNEFRKEDLQKTGKQALIIGICEACSASIVVTTVLFFVHLLIPDKLSLAQVLTLGAISAATAPAATLMVVRQFKAKGATTSLLLPIVALDDAIGLIIFAVNFGIAKSLNTGNVDIVSIVINPLIEIIASLALGAVMGWILTQLEKMYNSNANRLNLTIGLVFLTAGISLISFKIGPVKFGFSTLLTCMMLGTVFCNICPLSSDLMDYCDRWTSPLFALFFVVSGASLQLGVFRDIAIVGIGLVYIIFRCVGKYTGCSLSAKSVGCNDKVCKYLGITLFPQAGVALGMCTMAMALGEEGSLIKNITLFAVLIYELAGPMFTKWALTKAGDITPMSEEVKNRRQEKLSQLKK